jgi:hypothetical protein
MLRAVDERLPGHDRHCQCGQYARVSGRDHKNRDKRNRNVITKFYLL